MRDEPFILLPRRVVEHIRSSSESSQRLYMKHLPSEGFYVVDGFELDSGPRVPVTIPREYKALAQPGTQSATGQWFTTAEHGVNLAHWDLRRRPGTHLEPPRVLWRVQLLMMTGSLTGA